MTEKIMRGFGIAVLYGLASILLSAILLSAYLWYAWGMNQYKLLKMLAVAQGLDTDKIQEEIKDAQMREILDTTRDDVLRTRAMRNRNIEMQNDAAQKTLERIANETSQLENLKKEIEAQRAAFAADKKKLKEEAESAGIAELTTLTENMQPELAKKYLLDMYKNREYDRIILIIKGMDLKKRKNIINEFQTDEETSNMADILRRIGNGEPDAKLAEDLKNSQP
jgi:HAMP domain-containing protein